MPQENPKNKNEDQQTQQIAEELQRINERLSRIEGQSKSPKRRNIYQTIVVTLTGSAAGAALYDLLITALSQTTPQSDKTTAQVVIFLITFIIFIAFLTFDEDESSDIETAQDYLEQPIDRLQTDDSDVDIEQADDNAETSHTDSEQS